MATTSRDIIERGMDSYEAEIEDLRNDLKEAYQEIAKKDVK